MKKSIFITICLSMFYVSIAWTQNETSRHFDKAIQKCISQKPNIGLAKDFEMFDWAKTLQQHCAEVKDNKNTEVLFEIAEQREVVNSLLKLANNCNAIDSKMQTHLQKMQKIYDTTVKDEVKSKNTAKGVTEERTVTFDYASAVRLKIHINSIVNILQGDSSIFRIFKQ